MTHEALADASGLNRTYFTGVEAGRRNVSLDNVDRIARALGVDPIELLLEPRPEPKTETSNPSE